MIAVERGMEPPDLLRQIVRRELEEALIPDAGRTIEWEQPHGQHLPEGSTRRTLPPGLAEGIRGAVHKSGLSLRQAAEILEIDNSYLCRLTHGTRCPSHAVAARLVNRLPIDDKTADALLELSRDQPDPHRTNL